MSSKSGFQPEALCTTVSVPWPCSPFPTKFHCLPAQGLCRCFSLCLNMLFPTLMLCFLLANSYSLDLEALKMWLSQQLWLKSKQLTAQQSCAFTPHYCHISGNPSRAPSLGHTLQKTRPLPCPSIPPAVTCASPTFSHKWKAALQHTLGKWSPNRKGQGRRKLSNSPLVVGWGSQVWARPFTLQGIVDNTIF